jgi:hypothetical protein
LKLKCRSPLRAAGTLAGAVTLASALVIAAAPANASTAQFQWCDHLDQNVGIDAWSGSVWWGEASHGGCHTTMPGTNGNFHVDFFANNANPALQLGSGFDITPGENITITFSGSLNSRVSIVVSYR